MAGHAYWTHAAVGVYKGTKLAQSIDEDGLTFSRPPSADPNVPGGNDPGGPSVRDRVWFPLPTPVLVANARSRLLRVFVLYELSDAESVLGPVIVRDGPNAPGHCDPRPMDLPPFNVEIHGPLDLRGRNCLADLVDDVTRFNYTQYQPQVFFGLGLFVTIGVRSGFVRFTSVGADYEIA